ISLIMMVMEKTKDIAVLVSMGARRGQVRQIFILQGVLIGVIGTVLGLIVGYGVDCGRQVSLSCSQPGSLFHQLCTFRATGDRWSVSSGGCAANLLCCHTLSLLVSRAGFARGGSAL